MGATVFRGYDQAALDWEYDNRRKVADAFECLARYARESATARAEFPCRLDIRYGPHASETLDVFPAATERPSPIQVFIHAGYWQWNDKSDFSFVARAFLPAGAAVVVINYGLMPSVTMDEIVEQCRAAIVWVCRNALSFGGDPNRLFISGSSAGGHLVAMLMATDWSAFGVPADVIKGECGISGLYDLEPVRLCFLNEVLKLTAEEAQRNSPVHLAPESSGPLLLAVGSLEGPEYHRQTNDLADAWQRCELRCHVLDLSGLNHFSILFQLEATESDLSRAILRQMGLR